MRVRVPPASMAFTLLLSFLVAQPSFGIDMSLPALTVNPESATTRWDGLRLPSPVHQLCFSSG
jgi:hypothetical protein